MGEDPRAWHSIYSRCVAATRKYLSSKKARFQDEDDLVQEVFLQVMTSLLKNGPPEDLDRWLFGVAKNEYRRWNRRLGTYARLMETARFLAGRRSREILEERRRAELVGEIQSRLLSLPTDQRNLLMRKASCSVTALSRELGLSRPTVRRLLNQARRSLYRLLLENETPNCPGSEHTP